MSDKPFWVGTTEGCVLISDEVFELVGDRKINLTSYGVFCALARFANQGRQLSMHDLSGYCQVSEFNLGFCWNELERAGLLDDTLRRVIIDDEDE